MVGRGRRRCVAAGAVGAMLAAAGLIYATRFEPRRIVVERVRVPIQELPPMLAGFTMAHLSDLHCGAGRHWADHLCHAVQAVDELRPHLIVLTGDFIERSGAVRECAAILAGLKAPCGVVAVLGNHDYYGSPLRTRTLIEALAKAGIVVLRNEVYSVRGGDVLHVIGLDDAYTGHDKLVRVLERVPPEHGPRILLSHYPDVVERLAPATVDLVLSGHAHGGQLRLPGLAYYATHHHAGTRYARGLYDVEGTALYVSRGLGTSWPRARFLSPPEITHITLVGGLLRPQAPGA